MERVAGGADMWEGEMRGVTVCGVPVLLVRVAGELRAYVDRCPHLGVRLSEGKLNGNVLTCRAHQWQYDVTSGDGINPESVCLKRLPVLDGAQQPQVDVSQELGARTVAVGPVLSSGELASAITKAIRAENPEVRVIERAGYVRVLCPERCVLSRRAVEAELGLPFRLPSDLERVMPSFQGRLELSEEQAEWSSRD